MAIAKAVTCQSVGSTVYVRDEMGNLIENIAFPQPVMAQSFGSGISVTCGTLCYTYILENGQLKQVSVHSV